MANRWLRTGYSVASAAVLATGGCSLLGDRTSSEIRRVVIITIDTLRADHLGCYGYPRDTSPFLDRMAAEGVRFDQAFAPMSTTAPAHASLFSGLYPLQHRVMMNGHRMADDVVTFPEILSGAGFKTAAFVSTNAHFGVGNIAQGFDHLDEAPEDAPPYRPAARTVDPAIQWIDEQDPNDRILLWVHLFDPHKPYRPPRADLRPFAIETETYRDELAELLVSGHKIDPDFGPHGGSVQRMLDNLARYDAEIHYADRELARLHEHMIQAGLASNTLWVITADHGEGLGAHQLYGHGKNIYNEQLRVPLILHWPDGLEAATVIPDLVELTDLMPTILEMLLPEAPAGLAVGPGTSLSPLLQPSGDEPFAPRFAFAQRRVYETEIQEPGEKYALQSLEHKYIHRTEGADEFYAIKDDPYEDENLVGQGGEGEQLFKDHLLSFVERYGQDTPSQIVDAETLERLRSLGYVQ